MTRPLIAGFGCRRHCPAKAILAVLDRACRQAGHRAATAMAAPAFKADEPGLRLAAQHLGLPLILIDAGALAAMQARCVTRSARALRATGFGSVAEASALAYCLANPPGRSGDPGLDEFDEFMLGCKQYRQEAANAKLQREINACLANAGNDRVRILGCAR